MFEIGSSLREARLRRRIEIVQAEQATKIRGKYLRALEEERFEQLPSETYIKGFLRTYAEYLGLDGQLYVDEYNSRFVAGDEHDARLRRSAARAPEGRSRRLERNLVLAVLAVIAVTTVVLISGWNFSGSGSQPPKKPARVVHHQRTTGPVPYLEIGAAKGSSYVAVHRNGPAGTILFNGTIRHGQQPVPFSGKSFWFTVSSPENLVIKVAGRRISLPGLAPKVVTVTPTGWHVD